MRCAVTACGLVVLSFGGFCASSEAILRGRVIDAQTGQLSACTVAITDAQGRRISEKASFPSGFRSVGAFEKTVSPGRTLVRITRGPETSAFEASFDLAEGETREFQVTLTRRVDLRRRGWFAGDSHVHMIHGERSVSVDFDDVALAARAEDLQYLSVAHAWALENATPELLQHELSRRSTADCWLTWNLEAPKNYYRGDAGRCLGHGWSLGLRGRTEAGEDVIALLLTASAGDYASAKTPFANFESHRLIRAQGGRVFYSHPARWWTGAWGGQGGYPYRESMRISNLAAELPLDTLLGPTFDGLDVITGAGELGANAVALEVWSLLLNQGYRVAATGSSDACFDRPGGAVPGAVRTYTFLEGAFSLEAASEATAAGRTFVTTGPLVVAELDGQPPGARVAADGGERRLSVEAWAGGDSAGGLARIELVRDGRVVQTLAAGEAPVNWRTNFVVSAVRNAWYQVRVYGSDSAQARRAITGAFFFESGDYVAPKVVSANVRVRLRDALTGESVRGVVTEVAFFGPTGKDGARHAVSSEGVRLTLDGTHRLRAEARGYESLTLSPFLDNPPLLEAVTSLEADDLRNWATYEQIRELLSNVNLEFPLTKLDP